MDKPKGKWRCRACGCEWDGDQLKVSPFHLGIVWTCWDVFCGGTCDRVSELSKEATNEGGR